MLVNLDQVDWKIRHAEELPNHIRNLASDDDQLTIYAQEYIEEKILYGGINFQDVDRGYGISTILASDILSLMTPFLIELLTYEQVKTKAAILSMLRFIVGYVDFHFEGEIFLDRAKQIRQVIWKENKLYLNLLIDADASVRLSAFSLLSDFEEYAQILLPSLLEKIRGEGSTDTKSLMLWNLKKLVIENEILDPEMRHRFIDFLYELIVLNQAYPVRIVAAMLLIHFLREKAPFEVIKIVIQALIYENDPPSPAHLPFMLAKERTKSILELEVEKGIPAAIEVMRHTKHVENGYYALMVALILAFTPEAFPEYGIIKHYHAGVLSNEVRFIVEEKYQPHPNLQALDSLQKIVINAIMETDWVWETNSNVLGIFMLPPTKDGLKNLVLGV
jgi:hypothetical protein